MGYLYNSGIIFGLVVKRNIGYFFLKKLLVPRIKHKVLLIDDIFFITDSVKFDSQFFLIKSLENLVKLRLEAICPFDLNDILYGYIWQKKAHLLTIFVAYKARIIENYGNISHFTYILPRFFCNLMYNFSPKIDRAEIIGDYVNFLSSEKEMRISKTNLDLYCANLVPAKRKMKELFREIFRKIFRYSLWFYVFWIFLLFWMSGSTLKQGIKLSKLNENSNFEVVDEIEYNSLIVNRLQKFFDDKNFCLCELSRINDVRPDGIIFSEVRICSNSRTLSIRGRANSVNEVKDYQRALDELANVVDVVAEHVRAKDNEVCFDLEVKFE